MGRLRLIFLLIVVVFFLVQKYECRRCGAPTLVAGAMIGLDIKDYDHEMHELDPSQKCEDLESRFRTIDGTCNNVDNLGAANTRLKRLLPAVYDDGVESPRTRSTQGGGLQEARSISRLVLPDRRRRFNNTLLLMQWGQFLDHDMTLMPLPTERIQEGDDPLVCCGPLRFGIVQPLPEECFPITFPREVDFVGTCMEFVRTISAMKLDPEDSNEPREQVNSITAFIDASSVYGSSLEEEEELRQSEGHGYLLKFEDSEQGPLLPRTERTICQRSRQDPVDEPVCFIAGDERVNEQPDLATIHTIFLRLHNLLAAEMANLTSPTLLSSPSDALQFNETIFQSTRRVLGAVVQKIMYADWLPIILGEGFMEAFDLNVDERSEYDPEVDPSILNEFSTAAYRMGHSMVPRNLPTPDPDPAKLKIPLRRHFLRPAVVRRRFNALAMGLVRANRTTARDQAQAIDSSVSRELSEHLFEPRRRRRRGQDLMSLNIQRGRDHALQPYVRYREEFGLAPVTRFNHPAIRRARNLNRAYRSVEDIDLFVGGLSEPPNMGGGQLGDTFSIIVAEQMKRLKFGDRFFFTHDEPVGFTDRQLRQLQNVTSSKIMCLTVEPITDMQLNAFFEPGPSNPTVPCDELVGDLARDFLDLRDFVVEP